MPVVHFAQQYVEEATRACALDIKDPKAVFAYIFSTLSDSVKVYPTENYYYFTFLCNGVPYDGNFRLDAATRDDGKLIFAYSEDLEEWRGDTPSLYLILDRSAGVKVEKLEPLVYKVTYRDKSVVFHLNDLSQVRPPANALAPTEEFIGPTFDESGIRFFLVFDKELKIFHFILDETVRVADGFEPSPRSDRILIGKRTGFAFYRDHLRNRKILIGANRNNMETNTYFDGPFDQLPDNFIQGESLRNALLARDPTLKGRIDRFGAFPGGADRLSIDPYLAYREIDELYAFDRCARKQESSPSTYYLCFSVDYDDAGRPIVGTRDGEQRPRKSGR
jgi:hypothetical protein